MSGRLRVAVTGIGAITPIGGLLFLAGWGAILLNAARIVD